MPQNSFKSYLKDNMDIDLLIQAVKDYVITEEDINAINERMSTSDIVKEFTGIYYMDWLNKSFSQL